MKYVDYLKELINAKNNDAAIDAILAKVDTDKDISEDEWSLLCDQATELYNKYNVIEQGEILLYSVTLDTICNYYDLGILNNIDKVKEALIEKYVVVPQITKAN